METVVVSRSICRGRMVTKVLEGVKSGNEEACLRKGEEAILIKLKARVRLLRFELRGKKEEKKEKMKKKKKTSRRAIEQLR